MARNFLRYAAPVAVLLIPFVIRLLPYDSFVTADRIYFYGTDPYDHMRRVFLILHDFPKIPDFSYYQVFPKGTPLMMDPLFDFLIALIAYIAGLGEPSRRTVELIGVLIPPFIATAAVFAVYLLSREFMGKTASYASAFLFGIMPAYLNFSFAGQPDNNVAEPLTASLYFLFLLRTIKTRSFSLALIASLLGVSAILMWKGAFLFWFIAAATVVISGLIGREKSNAFLCGGLIFIFKGILLLSLALSGVIVRKSIVFTAVSGFHIIFLLLVGAGFLSAHAWRRFNKTGQFGVNGIVVSSVLLLLPLAMAVVFFSGFRAEIIRPFIMAGKVNAFTKTGNIEYDSIFLRDGSFSFAYPSEMLSLFFYIVPLALLWFLKRAVSSKDERQNMIFLLLSTAAFYVLTISHMRFGNLLSISIGILSGLVFERFVTPIRNAGKKTLFVLLFVLFCLPVFSPILKLTSGSMRLLEIQKEHFEAMDWIRTNTPKTSHYMEPWNRPEYGILSEWSLGSWVENVAERPTLPTNWTTDDYGVVESTRFLLADSEEDAVGILERNNIRYVIVTNIVAGLENYAWMLGRPGGYARLVKGAWTPDRKYFQLVSTSLLLSDGSPGGGPSKIPLKRLRHFRLLFESTTEIKATGLGRPIKKIKVFEYVRGARLIGTTFPGETVRVSLKLLSNQGRLFEYSDIAVTDGQGKFEILLPYPTLSVSDTTSAIGPYIISSMGKEKRLDIGEDMLSGASVEIDFISGNRR